MEDAVEPRRGTPGAGGAWDRIALTSSVPSAMESELPSIERRPKPWRPEAFSAGIREVDGVGTPDRPESTLDRRPGFNGPVFVPRIGHLFVGPGRGLEVASACAEQPLPGGTGSRLYLRSSTPPDGDHGPDHPPTGAHSHDHPHGADHGRWGRCGADRQVRLPLRDSSVRIRYHYD